jgi:hypothetical protein
MLPIPILPETHFLVSREYLLQWLVQTRPPRGLANFFRKLCSVYIVPIGPITRFTLGSETGVPYKKESCVLNCLLGLLSLSGLSAQIHGYVL